MQYKQIPFITENIKVSQVYKMVRKAKEIKKMISNYEGFLKCATNKHDKEYYSGILLSLKWCLGILEI